jgi:multidrug efflux pump subunit AcrA (membrane-fusion protein)
MIEHALEMNKKDQVMMPVSIAPLASYGRGAWTSYGLVAIVTVTGLLLSGCSAKGSVDEVAPTVTVQVGSAENETIQRKVIAEATLYPLNQAAIIPKVLAPVKKFYVDRNSRVHIGQLLAELENADLLGAQADGKAAVQQAEAVYQAAVHKAEQDLKLAKDVLDAAQKLYDSRQTLYKEGALSGKDVDDAKVALTTARNQFDAAQQQFDRRVAEAQLASAKGRSQSADAQVSYTKIVSPIDGVVTDRPVYQGELPPAGSPLITIMDLSQVVARAHVSQQEAASLKVGDPATITAPGQPPDVKGRVTLVSPALDPNSTTIEVWVQAANPGGRLKPGGSVQVAMVAESVPHAIVIPAAALLTSPGGITSVMVLDTDNRPHRKTVTVGIRSGGDVQITKGLQGGERVVTVGAFELDKEDDPVLKKTTIQVQAPKMPEEEEEQ